MSVKSIVSGSLNGVLCNANPFVQSKCCTPVNLFQNGETFVKIY